MIITKTGKNLIALLILVFVLLPVFVSAAPSWWPLVPCGTSANPAECTRCDLFRLFKNIIDFVLIGLMPPVAAILFVWGGFLILMGGANPGWITQGRTIFWNTFMGVLIISSSWLITNTIIKSLATEDIASSWYQFECRETISQQPPTQPPAPEPGPGQPPAPEPGPGQPPVPPQPPTGDICNNSQTLAQQHSTTYPRKRSPELEQLLSCIAGKLGQSMPSEGGSNSFYGSLYTYDISSVLCNYTRGDKHCDSSCSHATNSCHYGGSAGTEGSLAADFGNEKKGDTINQAALSCGAKSARCENAAGVTVSCSSSGATHIHISSKSCDRN